MSDLALRYLTEYKLLFESKLNKKYLDNLENTIKRLKRKEISKFQAKQEIEEAVSGFTNIRNINVEFRKGLMNCMVLPKYFLRKDDVKELFESSPSIEDSIKNVKEINIIIGNSLFGRLKPGEMVAVLLHEIGHSFLHRSNFIAYIRQFGIIIRYFSYILALLFSNREPELALLFGGLVVSTTRSIEFSQHKEEYGADKFATKYGYGMEMINAMKKIEGSKSEGKRKIKEFISNILRIILPLSHPFSRKRICRVINQMINEYSDLYPNIEKQLQKTLETYKCKI